ncbi:F-box domain-containing protein [Mycena venus]|uniref:F-box domain-containing protein n=1 Tax=Mycena venus TaxID=2733690 RepID=A0A8H6Y7V9_9AGAR|nr:F-box domain-containing protein [Mycena venus]
MSALVRDLLGEMMTHLPSIEHKFAFAQVSQLWRDVALNSHVFWSSFAGGTSHADGHRLPLILERSGSVTTLHIQLLVTQHVADWPADALKALVPYVARIEALEIEFDFKVDVGCLLNSNLVFPVLKRLCLNGRQYRNYGILASFTAPQLQTLDIERVDLSNWTTLLLPSLLNIRLYQAGDANVENLWDIFNRCPRAWRVVLHASKAWDSRHADEYFEVFARRPLAPALRQLDLRLAASDIRRVLEAGFFDVVLHTLTGCIYNVHNDGDFERLAGAILPGVAPLVAFELHHTGDIEQLELRDEEGHVRRLQCWNVASEFNISQVWEYLSKQYDIHKTVREIQLLPHHWGELAKIIESYPPQLRDGITLRIETDCTTAFPDDKEGEGQITKIMRIPGLAKVEFCGPDDYLLSLKTVYDSLAHIEPPPTRTVEVCIGNKGVQGHRARRSRCLARRITAKSLDTL